MWGLSTIFAPGEQERGDELDRRRAELDRQRHERGLIDQAELDRRLQQNAEQRIDVDAEVTESAKEGLQEGYDNVTSTIKETVRAPFKFAFDILPWQVWVGGAIALFLYLGGGVWIKGILARHK